MSKITFNNKSTLVDQPSVATENKVTASDMNEIKTVVNANADATVPVELYNSSSGTTGTVSLSDSSANYSYIEIFFKYNSMYKSVKVYQPDDKSVLLDFYDFNTNLIFETKLVKVSGSSITNTRYFHFTIANSGTWTPYGANQNNISITRVIGYV